MNLPTLPSMPNGHSPLIVPPAPLETLAAALGADVTRIERELRLELRAALAEHELRVRSLEQQIAEQAAQLAATPGPPGPPGEDGAPGPAGEAGPAGAPGLLPAVSEWKARVHYTAAVATHAGATWQAIRDTGTEPPGDDWRLLAAPGADARTPAFRGAWKAASAYEALDVVMVNGASFVALCEAPGACPGDGWRLIAARGSDGPKGSPGPTGERGYPGPPGPQPDALTVDNEGMLTLRYSDGSRLDCDLYPLLLRVQRGA